MCLAVIPDKQSSSKVQDSAVKLQQDEEEQIEILVRELHRLVLACQVDQDALFALKVPFSPDWVINEFWEVINKYSLDESVMLEKLKDTFEYFLDLIYDCLFAMPGQFKLGWFVAIKPAWASIVQNTPLLKSMLAQSASYQPEKVKTFFANEELCRGVVYFLWILCRTSEKANGVKQAPPLTPLSVEEDVLPDLATLHATRQESTDEEIDFIREEEGEQKNKEEQDAVLNLYKLAVESEQAANKKLAAPASYDFHGRLASAIVTPSPEENTLMLLKKIGATLNKKLHYSQWHALKPQVKMFASYDQALSNFGGFEWLEKYDPSFSCLVLRNGVDLDWVIKKTVKYVQEENPRAIKL